MLKAEERLLTHYHVVSFSSLSRIACSSFRTFTQSLIGSRRDQSDEETIRLATVNNVIVSVKK